MIHRTALVHPDVELGVNVELGPYVCIGFPGEQRDSDRPSGRVRIGDNAVLHEYAHVQSGIHGLTEVGDDFYAMAFTHVAHDCRIGNSVTLSTHATLSGHTTLGDYSTMGMNSSTHQYSELRKGSMLGAQGFLKGTTGEWEIWAGVPAKYLGPNTVGLERWQ